MLVSTPHRVIEIVAIAEQPQSLVSVVADNISWVAWTWKYQPNDCVETLHQTNLEIFK